MNPSPRCCALLLAFATASLGAQVAQPAPVARVADVVRVATQVPTAPVVYDISFPNAVHREGEVTVRFSAVPAGALRVRMARSSPGRYALHEFAKNVYLVRATDGTPRCMVPGVDQSVAVAPDALIVLPTPQGPVLFQVASARASQAHPAAER